MLIFEEMCVNLQPNLKIMNIRTIYMLCLAWVTALAMTSCLKGEEETDLSSYDDMAIIAFEITSVNRTLHKTSSTGTDSTYTSTISSGLPFFTIDQYQKQIYNTTPLPEECDLKKVLVRITAKNNGEIVIKSMTSDSLFYYNLSDSIDFSQPREVRVYALNGSGFRAYTVDMRMSATGTTTMQWVKMHEGAQMPQTATAGWDFKISADGITSSNDQWATQTEEILDTDAKLLPQSNVSFACWTLSDGTTYALLVGDNDNVEENAVVWRKVISEGLSSSWVYMPLDNDNFYYLPKGQYYWLLPFTDNSVLAINAQGTIFQSRDQGITWKTSKALQSPVTSVVEAATDGNGDIWLKDSEGNIWVGK